jgi:hypothetical protein
VLLRALSVTRQPEAIDFLVEMVSEGRMSDAAAALEALAVHKDSPEIRRRVQAAAESREGELREAFGRCFGSGEE